MFGVRSDTDSVKDPLGRLQASSDLESPLFVLMMRISTAATKLREWLTSAWLVILGSVGFCWDEKESAVPSTGSGT
jgi:hypothetical protein